MLIGKPPRKYFSNQIEVDEEESKNDPVRMIRLSDRHESQQSQNQSEVSLSEDEQSNQHEPEHAGSNNQVLLPQPMPMARECSCVPRILIVDDTEFNIIPVVMMLRNFFQIEAVDQALNGQQAVDMFTRLLNKPCGCRFRTHILILMDLSMPVMNGHDATKLILATSAGRFEPRIVAVTSHTNANLKESCSSVGMQDVFNKPLSKKCLEEILEEHFWGVIGL